MAPSTSFRVIDRLTLVVAVLIVALPATYLEVTRPSLHQMVASIQTLTGQHTQTTAPVKPVATAASKPATPAPAASAPATAGPVAGKTALTNTYVHLRAIKSTSSAILAQLPPGTTLQLRDDADATWQGVTYQGKSGYVYRAYLQY